MTAPNEFRDGTAGPPYDVDGPRLRTFRAKARLSLARLEPAERRAYGEAVEAAVLSKLRATTKTPEPRPACVSGTFANTGAEVEAAILRQQRAALSRAPSQIRRARSPREWRRLYEEAMQSKNPKPRTQTCTDVME